MSIYLTMKTLPDGPKIYPISMKSVPNIFPHNFPNNYNETKTLPYGPKIYPISMKSVPNIFPHKKNNTNPINSYITINSKLY